MNVALILAISFVISAVLLVWFIRVMARQEEESHRKHKLTKEEKAMKRMGAKF